MATTSTLSNNFKVYAADTCDATSRCINCGTGGSQTNDCKDFSGCTNSADGDDNAQTNHCAQFQTNHSPTLSWDAVM